MPSAHAAQHTHKVAVTLDEETEYDSFITALDALCSQHGYARSVSGDKIVLVNTQSVDNEGRTSLRHYGRHFGLAEEDYGTVFSFNGKRWRLLGVKPSRPRYPISAENMGDGRTFKLPKSVVPAIVALRMAQPAAPIATNQAPTPTPVIQTPQPQIPSGLEAYSAF